MSLNITNLLNTLKGYYNPEKNAGERYTGGDSGLSSIIETSGLGSTTERELTANNLSVQILESGLKVTVASESATKFSYKIDAETKKIIVFGNNLQITVDEENEGMIEVVGISNSINATSKDDKIKLIGYDNEVKAGAGEDEITIFGDDNKNIFSGVSGNTLIVNDKKFEVKVNDQNKDTAEITVSTSKVEDTGEIKSTINAYNAKIFTQETGENDKVDNIILNGNYNYIDTGDGADDISVLGDNNIIITGDDNLKDSVELKGKNNEVSGDENDVVTYTKSSGSIVLTNSDKSSHYIKVGDFEYFVQRNTDLNRDITITYELTSTGVFEFTGDNFKLTAVKDGSKDNIKITGDNNYVDTGDEADEIEIVGKNNLVHLGEGDDKVTVVGEENKIYGDDGNDSIAINGKNNETESFEEKHNVIKLNADNPGQTIEIGDKKYTITLTKTALNNISELKEVIVKYDESEDRTVKIEADNIIITAADGQEDKIEFKGSNSKIFAGDKNDEINVIGDNNYIDGWSGDDKITVQGIKNKAYGFLGNDEINITQRELTNSEIEEALNSISDTDEEGNHVTSEQKVEIANKNNANIVDGEFDTDTVNASFYTKVSKETEIYKSLSQSIKLDPKDDEKKIVISDDAGKIYTYTIKNYVTEENNNPFVSTRTISYDIVNGQLVVKGDFISVKADNGQDDNVKIVGSNNLLDMGDGDDTIYADDNCHYNLIFGGIGKDYINVKGNNNKVYGDNINVMDKDDSDTIIVNGSNNVVSGGKGDDDITLIGDSFRAFGNEGNDKFNVNAINSEIYGGNSTSKSGTDTLIINNSNSNKYYDFSNTQMKENENKIVLSPTNNNATIKFKDTNGETVVFNVEPNILKPEDLAGEIVVDYIIKDVVIDGKKQKQLVITGSNIMINLTNGSDKGVNVKLIGNDCRIETFAGDDNIEVEGNRNTIVSGNGKNKINVKGNSNQINGGKDVDSIDVDGDNNNIIRNGALDKINVKGSNNYTRYLVEDAETGGSIVLTKANGPQIIMINNRTYELTIYGLKGENLDNASINVSYQYDKDGYMCFYAENVKIRVLDSKTTLTTDEVTTDNKDSIKLYGSNCYISSGNGDDVIIVEGNNNTVDGWYGNDSLRIIGDDNKIRGFDGDDKIIVEGNNNYINGEQGQNTLTINSGENNTYINIDKVEKK